MADGCGLRWGRLIGAATSLVENGDGWGESMFAGMVKSYRNAEKDDNSMEVPAN
jgi:hypothetical protein